MCFKHPLNFGWAKTYYKFWPKERIIKGEIKFHQNVIAKKYLYFLADDSCQFNRVIKPNGIGVTANLKVKFHQDVLTSTIQVKVRMGKQEISQKGKMKTWIEGQIYDAKNLYVTYEGLFVESHLIPKTELNYSDEQEIEIRRDNDDQILSDEKIMSISNNEIFWKNGYGPKNHVHGGLMLFPIFDSLAQAPLEVQVNYKRVIPLLSTSYFSLHQNTFQIFSQGGLQVDGNFIY